jgi:hypothetical protein
MRGLASHPLSDQIPKRERKRVMVQRDNPLGTDGVPNGADSPTTLGMT